MGSIDVNALDAGIAIVVLLSAVLAFFRGFVREVLAVAGWIGAVFAALYGLPLVRPYARDLIPIDMAADAVAGGVIFLVVLVTLSLVTHFISRRVQESTLNALDRSLGVLFGIARGAVIVVLAYMVVGWLVPPAEQPGWMRDARTMPLVERGRDVLVTLVPGTFGAAEDATRGAADTARKARETKEMLDRMSRPEPAAEQGDGDGADGYSDDVRNSLQRLLESTADPETAEQETAGNDGSGTSGKDDGPAKE